MNYRQSSKQVLIKAEIKMQYDLGFIGAGKMGGAILSAVLDSGQTPSLIAVCDAKAEALTQYANRGAVTTADPLFIAENCKTIVLAVKPQDINALMDSVAPKLHTSQLVISIAAGKSISTLRAHLGKAPTLIRVMPNLAALVGEGMMVYAADDEATANDIAAAEAILSKCGKTLRLEEKHFDAVTALSGSGPAFLAYIIKAMADGGEALGLSQEAASTLALQTMLGTAKYLIESHQPFPAFINAVSSPGGTTEAGMKVLANSEMVQAISKTLSAAARRSAELG